MCFYKFLAPSIWRVLMAGYYMLSTLNTFVFIYWELKIYKSTFNDIVYAKKKSNHKIRAQECYRGRAMSCDIMWHHWHDRGVECHRRGDLSWWVDQFGNWIIRHISTKINYVLTLCALLPIFLMKYNPWKGFWMTINYKINHVIWNSFYWCRLLQWCHTGPPTSNKKRFKSIFFKAYPAWICFKFTQLISTILLCILCKYEANPCRESFEKKQI